MRKHWAGHTRDRGQRTEDEEHLPDIDNTQTEGWTDRNLELPEHRVRAFIDFIVNSFLNRCLASLSGKTVGQFANAIIALNISSAASLLTQVLTHTSVT